MHLGNVYAALMSWLSAKKKGGEWLLRVDDIDGARAGRAEEFSRLAIDDLRWLGLVPDGEVLFQSRRTEAYEAALSALERRGLVYDCFCSRADIIAAGAPHMDGSPHVYSGRCRFLSQERRAALAKTRAAAKRVAVPDVASRFVDGHFGEQSCALAKECGDFVARRSDGVFAYQLATAVDDAFMGVTEVVRGRDLIPSTHMQLFVYKSLGLSPPAFFHIPLLVSKDGRRLAKRAGDGCMDCLREKFSREEVIGRVMFLCGFTEREEAMGLDEALSAFDWERLPKEDIVAR